MSKFSFTKQKHNSKTNVWYDGILIGELSFVIREDPNIDWPKYRSDKTLKLPFSERWITTWKAHTGSKMTTLGEFTSMDEAAQAILDKHRMLFKRESDENNS